MNKINKKLITISSNSKYITFSDDNYLLEYCDIQYLIKVNPIIEIKRNKLWNNIVDKILSILKKEKIILKSSKKTQRNIITSMLSMWIALNLIDKSILIDSFFPYNATYNGDIISTFVNLGNLKQNIAEDLFYNKLKLIELVNNAIFDLYRTKERDVNVSKKRRGNKYILKCSGNKVSVISSVYDKLKSRFKHNDKSKLDLYIFCLVLRYKTLMGHGHQLAMKTKFKDKLRENYNIYFECFASSINVYYPHYCSLFYDIEKYFGSFGSFYLVNFKKGFYIANPPYSDILLNMMVNKFNKSLELSNDALSFCFGLPDWISYNKSGGDKDKLLMIDNGYKLKYFNNPVRKNNYLGYPYYINTEKYSNKILKYFINEFNIKSIFRYGNDKQVLIDLDTFVDSFSNIFDMMLTDIILENKIEKIIKKYKTKKIINILKKVTKKYDLVYITPNDINIEKYWGNINIGGYFIINLSNLSGKNKNALIDINKFMINIQSSIYYGNLSYQDNNNLVPLLVYRRGNSKLHKVTENYNPKLKITDVIYKNKKFKVLDDSYLIGGTKQRALVPFLNIIPEKNIVYAGPSTGYAQVALAYSGKIVNKNIVLFFSSFSKKFELTKKAKKLNPTIEIIILNKSLKNIEKDAEDYCKKNKSCYLIPFGGRFPAYTQLLSKKIIEAYSKKEREKVKRLWLVIGSAAVLTALYDVFPNAYFFPVQVGRKVYQDIIDIKRTKWPPYISKINFIDNAIKQPSYKTVKNYDAKLWEFVEKYGKNGDYIWNVAG